MAHPTYIHTNHAEAHQPAAEQQKAAADQNKPDPRNPFLASPDETALLFDSIHGDIDAVEAEQASAELDSDSESEDDRSEAEIEGIAWEMRQLENKFTDMRDAYKLVDRLGEGV